MSLALYYKEENELTTKSRKPVKKETGIVYTDKDGNQKVLATSAVKSYADTDFFKDSSGIFEQLPEDRQAFFGKVGGIFDEDGRPSLTDRNIVVLDVIQMSKGPYGPYYAMHVVSEGDPEEDSFAGEFSILTRGQVVHETIEALSGISLQTGKRIAPGELPVAIRVSFAEGEGDYDGYYYPLPPVSAAEAVEV